MNTIAKELENAVLETIDGMAPEIADVLRDLVRFQSVNPPGLEKACSEYVAACLEGMGVATRLIEGSKDRPNVVGILKGSGKGPNLLFYGGHVDVVPAGDESLWKHPPFEGVVEDGWLYGRGAADHKGSIAASLASIKALQRLGVRLKGDLVYIVVVDEENMGHQGAKFLVRGGHIYGDMAVLGGPGELNEVILACKGLLQLRITVKGRSAHSSAPWLAVNPIEKAARIILALQSMRFEKSNPLWPANPRGILGGPTGVLSVTMVKAGVKVNVIPETCEIVLDRRLIPEESPEEALEQITAVLRRCQEEDATYETSLEVFDAGPGAAVSPKEPIVRIVQEAAARLGIQTTFSAVSGSSDSRWIINEGKIPMVIYGAGLLGPDRQTTKIHGIDECVSTEELLKQAKVYALIMLYACGVEAWEQSVAV